MPSSKSTRYIVLGLSLPNDEIRNELKRKQRQNLVEVADENLISVKKKVTCSLCEGTGIVGVHKIDDILMCIPCTKCDGKGTITLWEYQMNKRDR